MNSSQLPDDISGEFRDDDAAELVRQGSIPEPSKTEPSPEEVFSPVLRSLVQAGVGAARDSEEFSTQEVLEKLLKIDAIGQLIAQDPRKILHWLGMMVTQIDDVINLQLNEIIHHSRFQKLESSWRGLSYLHECKLREDTDEIKIKILNVSWAELENDFRREREFDQSTLFKAVYENEFGQAGGHPFGVLIGDYEIRPKMSKDYGYDDLSVLRSIAQVAAASFCPFVAGTSPEMFDFDDFSRLERTVDLDRYFRDSSFFQWQKLREEEDSRFLGLTMPRVLMRLPYEQDTARIDSFRFREDVEKGADVSSYLWGNAAYAFAGVLLRSFASTNWFIDTRGVEPGVDGGGLVPGLPVQSFKTDRNGIVSKPSTDVVVSENLERTLSGLGFIPLCHCQDTEFSAFFSNRSVQKPANYASAEANASARMSSMLQYMFCVSRFAHFLKVMARDLIGSLSTDDLQRHLNNWLADYICGADSSPEVKVRRPLEDGRVTLVKEPGKAGSYQCIIQLKPHFELEELVGSITLNTQMAAAHKF